MRVLLTGASGQLGAYLLPELARSGHEVVAWSGSETGVRGGVLLRPVDLTDANAIECALAESNPEAILHAAAISSAEAVRRDPERARVVNIEATARLCEWCASHGRRIVFTSTDLVFDGTRPWNTEEEPARPVLAYGRTKLAAEPSVLACPRGLVARVSLLYGPSRCGRQAFFDKACEALRSGRSQSFFEDEFRTPLDLTTAAVVLRRLLESSATGVIHVGGSERMSRYELMRRSALALGLDASFVRANRRGDAALTEPRPADVSLATERLAGLLPDLVRPSVEDALEVAK